MKRENVTIQSPTIVEDREANVTRTWSDIGQVEGVILPYGNDRALKDYGFSETVKFRFFYKGSHPELKVGNQIIHKGMKLSIVYVADYGKAMDVLLNS